MVNPLLTGLGGLPPVLPPVPDPPGPAPAAGAPQETDPLDPGLLDPRTGKLIPGTVAPGGSTSPFAAGGWAAVLPNLLHDLEVYGFLLLLVAIGLYGLFAPQAQTVVKTAAKVAAL